MITSPYTSLLVIDSRVTNWQSLLATINTDVAVLILNPIMDGLNQIATAITAYSQLQSIHIIAHGASGQLLLGATLLNDAVIANDAASLQTIGQALSAEGDIFLYGCNLAQGSDGTAFIAHIAALTAADVVASDDVTGAAVQGGNWTLEVSTGVTAKPLQFASTYAYTLLLRQGTGNNDTLNGTSNDDQLYGLGGNDSLSGLAGNDLLDGGTGNDALWGQAGNDSLIGADANDYLDGAENNDSLAGGAGNDTLWGGFGIDTLNAGDGNDYLDGGDGSDTDTSNDYLNAGAGLDTLFGSGGNDSLSGGDGNDQLDGGSGNDTLNGDAGDDTLYGSGGIDSLNGGDGNDQIDGGEQNDNINGGAGADYIYGHDANDSLLGGDGNDQIEGSGGNDTLNGGTGKDSLFGGAGNDSYYVDNLNDVIQEDSGGGDDTVYINVNGYKVPNNIEHTVYAAGVQVLPYFINTLDSGFHWGDVAQATNLSYSFVTSGVDNITPGIRGFATYSNSQKAAVREALATYSTLSGLTFSETTDSTAVDMRFFRDDLSAAGYSSSAGYTWYPTRGDVHIKNTYSDLSKGSYGFELLLHEIGHGLGLKHPFEAPVLTESEDSNINTVMSYEHDSATNATEPRLFDQASIQYLYGVNLNYNSGNNTYHFSDRYIGDGAGTDTVSAAEQSRAVTINLTAGSWNYVSSKASSILSANQLFIGYGTLIENASGGSGNDTLTGNTAVNSLQGGNGNDTLNGGAGADKLNGGAGNDSYSVDNSADVITESSSSSTEIDSVSTSVSYTLATNVENLTLTGTAAINATGNASKNTLIGNSGANLLSGGAEADSLNGGLGADTLVGGLAKDSYNLSESTVATDTVRLAVGDSVVSAYDVVSSFKIASSSSTTAVDKLDLPSTTLKANTSAFNGIDAGVIHSNRIVNGLITFDDSDSYSTALTLTSSTLANAISYLQSNITTSGNTVLFTALGNSYVFQDGGSNDSLIQLTGLSASSLSTTGTVVASVWLV